MERGTNQIIFALLRSAVCGTELSDAEKALCSAENLPETVKTAQKHDIDHLLAYALKKNGLLPENGAGAGAEKAVLKAVYRYEQMNMDFERVCRVFEEEKIPFMPLKGSVIRKYYPEEWMRTSCDIDILVPEDIVEKAADLLADRLNFERRAKHSHDIPIFTPAKFHIELHYSLLEDGRANGSSEILKSVWETARVRDGYGYWYEMPDEMFYFYHIAHMAKHFETGGCGIRPFIDLWILDNLNGADASARNELLSRGGLLKFAESARRLSQIWFEGREADKISSQMENYILRGGVYGIDENRITVQQQKNGGGFKYALSKIFIPYDVIKFHYPILQKHRWLTPLMEVRRWLKLVFCGHAKRTVRELKYNSRISADEAEAVKNFLSGIGL